MAIGNINYHLIADASDYYSSLGYTIVDVPWTASEEAYLITRPPHAKDYWVEDRLLVASAEQSLIELLIKKELPPGKYQAISPCFRYEKNYDELRKPHFIKLELMDCLDTSINNLMNTIQLCKGWFDKYLKTEVIETVPETWDICNSGATFDIASLGGIELGSYGIRSHPAVGSWIYATGCAEPRLSTAILS